MRCFKKQADRIVELIDNRLHLTTVEELLPLLKDAAEQYRRENPELSRRCFDVDIQGEYVDFAFWNPDSKCTESSSFARNQNPKDKAGDESLLGYIRRSIRRLAEDAKTVLWYEFPASELKRSLERSNRSRYSKEPERYGLKNVRHSLYAVREDKIVDYVDSKYQVLKRLHQG